MGCGSLAQYTPKGMGKVEPMGSGRRGRRSTIVYTCLYKISSTRFLLELRIEKIGPFHMYFSTLHKKAYKPHVLVTLLLFYFSPIHYHRTFACICSFNYSVWLELVASKASSTAHLNSVRNRNLVMVHTYPVKPPPKTPQQTSLQSNRVSITYLHLIQSPSFPSIHLTLFYFSFINQDF